MVGSFKFSKLSVEFQYLKNDRILVSQSSLRRYLWFNSYRTLSYVGAVALKACISIERVRIGVVTDVSRMKLTPSMTSNKILANTNLHRWTWGGRSKGLWLAYWIRKKDKDKKCICTARFNSPSLGDLWFRVSGPLGISVYAMGNLNYCLTWALKSEGKIKSLTRQCWVACLDLRQPTHRTFEARLERILNRHSPKPSPTNQCDTNLPPDSATKLSLSRFKTPPFSVTMQPNLKKEKKFAGKFRDQDAKTDTTGKCLPQLQASRPTQQVPNYVRELLVDQCIDRTSTSRSNIAILCQTHANMHKREDSQEPVWKPG